MKITIVELDLKGYSDTARELEEHSSADVVLAFNEQIQSFVDAGLKTAGVKREDTVLATTGDGAIVMFDHVAGANTFAEAVHRAARLHNKEKTLPGAMRWFRIGIATGDLAIKETDGKRNVGGTVIARAVRLEAAASVGEIVADEPTYSEMTPEVRACYGEREYILGKREERFEGRRYRVIPGPASALVRAVAATQPAKPGRALARWLDKLDFLRTELATAVTREEKYKIKCDIEEAKEMIAELGG